jgi:hypothetical protein
MSVAIRLIGAIAVTLAACLPAWAFDTPEELVSVLYDRYVRDDFPDDTRSYFSSRTQALWLALENEDPYGLGFDPIVDGQDYEVTALEIAEPVPVKKGVEIRVTFRNFGEPRDLVYRLVEEPEGWRIDDIVAESDPQWRLRELLGE